MHMVLGDEIAPGALLDLDAIALIAATIVNVVQRDDALAHDVIAVVGTEIHAFCVTVAMVDVIAGQKEALGVGAVRTEADFIRVMNVALIDPHIRAVAEPNAVTATRELDAAQAQELHRAALTDIEYVLFVIRPRDDDLRSLGCDDPDRCLRCAAHADVPHALDAVSASGDLQLVSRLQGFHGLHKFRSVRIAVLDHALRRDGGPGGFVAGSQSGRGEGDEEKKKAHGWLGMETYGFGRKILRQENGRRDWSIFLPFHFPAKK